MTNILEHSLGHINQPNFMIEKNGVDTKENINCHIF